MKKLILIFIIVMLFIGCKSFGDKIKPVEITKPNLTGDISVITTPLTIGKRYNLIYNNMPIKGDFKINGPWITQYCTYLVDMSIGDKEFVGKLIMTQYFRNAKIEIIYNGETVTGEVSRDIFAVGNWSLNLNFNGKVLLGAIKSSTNISDYTMRFMGKKILGTKTTDGQNHYFDLKFGDVPFKGNIIYKKQKNNFSFETGEITDYELISFLIMDLIRITEEDFEANNTSN